MPWSVEPTDTATAWMRGLSPKDFERISGPLALLREQGPALGFPNVKRIKGSQHHNMKEVRSAGGNLRILFAFDSNRKAILLVGGDKTNQWQSWYERNIPLADRLLSDHLRKTGGRTQWRSQTPTAGRRSAASGR
jgi:hypothetical protein